jgi:hypothetical protein
MALDNAELEMWKIDPYNIYTHPCLNNTRTYGKKHRKRYVTILDTLSILYAGISILRYA